MDDLAREHLLKFAQRFVATEFRKRWIHILLESPRKAKDQLVKFERHLDERYCTMLNGDEVHSENLIQLCGPGPGLYFDGVGDPSFMRTEDATDRACDTVRDAVFSLRPGRRAVFFFHEGYAWYCDRESS